MGNTVKGIGITLNAKFRNFDALPPAVREVFARAPYDYHTGQVLKHYRKMEAAGMTPRAIRQTFVDGILIDISKHAARDYGREHPQVMLPARGQPLAVVAERYNGGVA
jgi:hypothetical protein